MVQWLGLGTFTAWDPGSIPGQGTKIPKAAAQPKKKKKKKKEKFKRTSLAVQWLRLSASTAGGTGHGFDPWSGN